LRRCSSPHDAPGVVAETFAIAWRRVDDMPAGDAARPWLYRARIDSRWTVESAEPYSSGAVMLMIRPTGPVPPDIMMKIKHPPTATPAPYPSDVSRG
jgi:hypothetical protein